MNEAAHPLALVVDDEEILRLFAAGLFEEHGFDVMGAENAAAALRVLESHRDVRLLFTDIQMPGGSAPGTSSRRGVAPVARRSFS
jgi:CheY-like chemotaxis protein